MKNILFISYDGMTDPLGQSQVIPYLVRLAKYGFRFTILSCEKRDKFLENKDEIERILNVHSVKWIPIRYHKNPKVLSTVFDVYKLKKRAGRLHQEEKFDMVHARPGIPALVGVWMNKKYRVRFLNDIREFYADSRVDGRIWDNNNFFYNKIYRFFKRKENEAVAQSDGIVCLTYAAEKIIKQWPQYKKEIPIKVIPCSVDTKLFDPGQVDPDRVKALKKTFNIVDGEKIISYLGSIGSWYLTDEMMQLFKMISDTIPDAKFLFISPSEHNTILNAAMRSGLSEARIIITKAKRSEVPTLLSLSQYAVFFIKPCYSKQSSSPTKHGEIMAMGIPVITNAGVGDVADIVMASDSGIVLNGFDTQSFQLAVDKIANGTAFNKDAIRKAAIEYYDLDQAVSRYLEIYREILQKEKN